MTFRPDSPFELPNGHLVCGPHRLGGCGICTVDYDFMYEDEDCKEETDDSDFEVDPEKVREGLRKLGFIPSDPLPAESGSSLEPTAHAGFAIMLPGSPGPNSRPNPVRPDFEMFRPLGSFTGRVIPKKFVPPQPTDRPQGLFPLSGGNPSGCLPSYLARFKRANDKHQFLIYTDGACSDNGGPTARGGCSFIYKRCTKNPSAGRVSFPLECRGPTGERHQHTSNRAELRAVIAALRYRRWDGEGCKSLVIATDSEYVANGATIWVKAWRRKGWKTRSGAAVKNQDLWQCLLGEIELYGKEGMRVQFWRIPRQWNEEADRHAKDAVNEPPVEYFDDIHGLLT
ncbi:uncharacterized protein N7458_007079 [Penicillium daleae]|uniref:ribonuclease H n=1 Tax=Penicillium daleae TaxID=63821 RepID=A0AAD6C610_9EURO|nr:uncharacterized protein N7458_007079 [Penicillium daleae]KAJ5450630.1 hypothetical protein N7458_007079 [Penicillium daleae]